jgi:hypothetical protein
VNCLHRKRAVDFVMATERQAVIPHPLRPLRQHLERMLRAKGHDGEDLVDHLVGDEVREQVRHRADEDHPRLFPAQRGQQHFGVEENLDVGAMPGLEGQAGAEALVHAFGVAVLAARRRVLAVPADLAGFLVARADRRPARIGPFDLGTCIGLISVTLALMAAKAAACLR